MPAGCKSKGFHFFLDLSIIIREKIVVEIGAAVVPDRNVHPAGSEITGTRTFSAAA
jgi:hypothetical protein